MKYFRVEGYDGHHMAADRIVSASDGHRVFAEFKKKADAQKTLDAWLDAHPALGERAYWSLAEYSARGDRYVLQCGTAEPFESMYRWT